MLFLFLACPQTSPTHTDAEPGTDTGEPADTADSGPADSGETGGSETPATNLGCEAPHDAFIAALQADLDASDALGVSAAILENGVVTCRVALGRKLVDGDEVPNVETLFQIGSTTKMFTAVALLQNIEAGDLTLDTPLAEAYPDSEFALNGAWNDEIRMRHLLTHQGAFYDYLDWTGSDRDSDLAEWHESVFFPNLWLMADPGSFWNYANPNFTIAGLIVEHLDGSRYYPDIMREDVFAPLGMDRTFQRKSEAEADGNYAEGFGYVYTKVGGSDYKEVPIDKVPDLAAARPAGSGTWTTPTQMLQMALFLMDGNTAILSDADREAMTTEQVSLQLTADNAGYGYGVFVYPGVSLFDGYHPVRAWDHGGNTLSYSSSFTMLPDQHFAVSILSSGYGTDFSTSVATAVSTLVTDLPPLGETPEYSFDPDRLDLHVGTYTDQYNVGDMIVTRDGDVLNLEMPLLDSMGYTYEPELIPVSSDIWYVNMRGNYYDLTFIQDGGGPSKWVRDRAFVGTRAE